MAATADETYQLGLLRGARQVGSLYARAAVVVIRQAVLDDVLEFSEQDLARERGGFLLGGVYGDAPPYAVIRHFHPANEALGGTASLTFTHDSWAAVTREIELNQPGEVILGWQHTHPGMGVFLSAYDLFIQRHFFSQAWQVALVVDPKSQEFAFFHWRGNEVRDCGFLCVEG
jgi:proteasome lid subunit RPN8/RPN11